MEEAAQAIPFGLLLKRFRRAAHVTQDMLAERAGYSTTYLSKLERGERQPLAFTVATLAEALGLDAEACAALERAAQSPSPPARRRPQAPVQVASSSLLPLVGRAQEQTLLARYLSRAEPPLLLVRGEPGIGKTRLLQEAARQGLEGGWRVLEGRCHRHSSQELYAPLLGAIERHLAELSESQQRQALQQCEWLLHLLPELAERTGLPLPSWNVPPAQERRLLFAAVQRFLDQIAGVSGTLLVLDDLQWASVDTFDVLSSLLRSDARHPLLIIGAYRSTDVRSSDPLSLAMTDIAREVGAERIELGPLAPPEARELLGLLVEGSLPPESGLVETVLRRAGGVPYFLVSCAQGLRAGSLGGESREGIPWQVAETIRQRVGALSEEAQYLLGAVAVAGSQARRGILLALAAELGWGKRTVLTALEGACQARLLVEQNDSSYAFAHDLIREVLTEDMSAVRRAILHQHIAGLLEQAGGQLPVEALAYHYHQAGLPEKAVVYLERAGDHALSAYAHEQAERCYQAWLDHLAPLQHPDDAARARVKLSAALYARGHYREALSLLEAALAWYQETHDLEEQATVMEKMGQAYAALGEGDQGIPFLQDWLTAPHLGTLSASRQAALYLTVTYLLMNSSRTTEALSAAQHAAALAEQAQDPQQRGVAGWYLGRVLMLLGRLKEGAQTLEAAIPLAERASDLRCLCYLFLNLSFIADERGELVVGKAYAERAILLAEQLGTPVLLANVLASRGFAAFMLGDWRGAEQDYEQAMTLMRGAGMPWGAAYPLLHLGTLFLAQGQELGSTYLGEASELAKQSGDRLALRMAQSVLAEQELLLGSPKQAYDRLVPLLEEAPQEQQNPFSLLPLLAWIHLELGEHEEAQLLVQQARAGAAGERLRPVLVEVLLVQARLAAAHEHWQEAAEALDVALGLCREMPWPLAEGKTRYVCGLVARKLGETAQARDHFTAALTILHRLGERLYANVIPLALEQLPLADQHASVE